MMDGILYDGNELHEENDILLAISSQTRGKVVSMHAHALDYFYPSPLPNLSTKKILYTTFGMNWLFYAGLLCQGNRGYLDGMEWMGMV